MWFRQLALFRLDPRQLPDFDKLETALARHPFATCGGLDWYSDGFVPAAPHKPDQMLARAGGAALVTLKREDKVLPAAVVRDFVERRVAEIEEKELRQVGRKEKKELRETGEDDLLPRAFTKSGRSRCYIDPQSGWLVADAGGTKAENLVSAIREQLPPFPARLPRTALSPATAMTMWLAEGAPDGFELDSDCELKSPGDDGATIRCARQDLTAQEVRQHVDTGKQVTRLGLIWQERIRFVLTDKLELKRVQFLDVIEDEASQAGDDAEALFDATLLLMVGELRGLIGELIEALGGELPVDGESSPAPAPARPAPAVTPTAAPAGDTSVPPWE